MLEVVPFVITFGNTNLITVLVLMKLVKKKKN